MRVGRILDRLGSPSAREWEALATHPDHDGEALDALQKQARDQRRALDRFLLAAAPGPRRSAVGLAGLSLPQGTDWRWRPPVLSAPISPAGMVRPDDGQFLGDSARLFHDCPERALSLRQIRNRRATDPTAFGLVVETFGFSGSFLSLAIPLPRDALAGLSRSHILRVGVDLDFERVTGTALRLNIENGPNRDQLQVPLDGLQRNGPNRRVAEFDLAETEIEESRISNGWIDILFIEPAMSAVALRDMVVSRHPRAEI